LVELNQLPFGRHEVPTCPLLIKKALAFFISKAREVVSLILPSRIKPTTVSLFQKQRPKVKEETEFFSKI